MSPKIIFLMNHPPNPRIVKRVNSFLKITKHIFVIFWDRPFFMSAPLTIHYKKIKAPNAGKLLNRILIILKSFLVSTYWLFIYRPTIIYVSGIDMLILGCIYKIFLHKVRIILEIGDIHNGKFYRNKFFHFLLNKFVKKIDLLVLTSPFFWENYYKKFISDRNKVFIMENYPEKKIFKNCIYREHERLTIGFVGFIRYPKQIEMLFESCIGLENKIKIIVSGIGPDYEYIKKISKNYNNVEVTGPYNYEQDIVNIYSKIDIVYSVYDADLYNVKIAIPNRLYEAIVCGLPIIVAKNTALSKIVKKYGIGFEVSHSDINDLRKLIVNILNNPRILERCRENALRISENFYYEKIEEEFIKKIMNLITKKKYG